VVWLISGVLGFKTGWDFVSSAVQITRNPYQDTTEHNAAEFPSTPSHGFSLTSL